jgi:hypothetical protein
MIRLIVIIPDPHKRTVTIRDYLVIISIKI